MLTTTRSHSPPLRACPTPPCRAPSIAEGHWQQPLSTTVRDEYQYAAARGSAPASPACSKSPDQPRTGAPHARLTDVALLLRRNAEVASGTAATPGPDELQSHERRLATRSLAPGEAVVWPSSADALGPRPERQPRCLRLTRPLTRQSDSSGPREGAADGR